MEEYDEDLVGVYRAGSHEMDSWIKNKYNFLNLNWKN